jgi:hypothetical protein
MHLLILMAGFLFFSGIPGAMLHPYIFPEPVIVNLKSNFV